MILLLLTATSFAQDLLVGDLIPGDLVISEVMRNPDAAADADGEWFEIYNASGLTMDLQGLEVADFGTDSEIIGTSLFLGVGDYAVVAVSADSGLNGGITPDAVIPLTLANGDDELALLANGFLIEEIVWGAGWPAPTGASMVLAPGALDDISNDSGVNWCAGLTPFGAGDLGSPGAANSCTGGGTGSGTGGGTGSGTGGTGSGTGGTGSGTGGTTGSGTGGSGSGTGGGAGTGGIGTATGGTGTGTGDPVDDVDYAKLGCGCTHGSSPAGWLGLALLPLVARRRR